MAIDRVKQIEVFIAFVIDFKKLKNSVAEMIKHGTDKDVKKVQTMYGYIADYMDNTGSIDEIIEKMMSVPVTERVQKLVMYLKSMFEKDKESYFEKIQNDFNDLDHFIETHHITRNVNDIFGEDLVTSDPTVPIEPEDLNFLNEIGKLSVQNVKIAQEAEKNFKTLTFRNKIIDLYTKNLFYFEQVFSNADTRFQKKILQVIEEHHDMIDPTDEQKEALQSLQDIGILSDIDTLALKSKSNVSDHQAFDAFCKILRKNNNVKLLNKVLRENIIMTSMFKTNSSTIGQHYGLRKMFVSARYPHNQRIVTRYMQLMEKNEADMGIIFKFLRKDMEFNKAYETYIKSKDTVEFKKFVVDLLGHLNEDDTSNGTLESLAFVVQSFIYMDKHDTDILTLEDVYEYMNRIYYYMHRNKLYEKELTVNDHILEFQRARLNSFLNEKVDMYAVDNKAFVYGFSPGDIWYKLNIFMDDIDVSNIDKIFFKYNEITSYSFEPGKPLKFIDKELNNVKADQVGERERMIITADVDRKNFEIYIFGLCGRIAKALYKDGVETTVSVVEGGFLRKKQTPGLDKEVDIAIRKAVNNILTLQVLLGVSENIFGNIYNKKIERILEEMYNIKVTKEELDEYVLKSPINISGLAKKKSILALREKREKFNFKTTTDQYVKHASELFALFNKLDEE